MKILKIASILVILFSAILTSCETQSEHPADVSGSGESSNSVSADTENHIERPETEDLNGASLVILNYKAEDMSWANSTILVDDINGDTLNDALFDREKKVEDTYHCQIEEIKMPELVRTLKNSVAAGQKDFDCAMIFDASVSGVLTTGNLISWDNLEIDYSLPWWETAITEQFNFYGIQAAVSGAYSLYNYSTRHCVVFNQDLKDELDITDDFYQLVREGKWTLDAMYTYGEMAASDLNGDGKITGTDDRFGMTGTPSRYYSALLTGAGIRYIDRKEDGTLYYSLVGNESAQSFMAKIVQYDSGNKVYSHGSGGIGECDAAIFPSGRALFFTTYVGDAVEVRDIEYDIGFLIPPKMDEEQPEYYSLVEGGAHTVLPKTVSPDDYHRISVILNAFAYESYCTSIPAYIENLLMGKVSRNEDSTEMLQLIFDRSAYDLGAGIFSQETKNNFTTEVFYARKDVISSVIAKTEEKVNAKLEAFREAILALDE